MVRLVAIPAFDIRMFAGQIITGLIVIEIFYILGPIYQFEGTSIMVGVTLFAFIRFIGMVAGFLLDAI